MNTMTPADWNKLDAPEAETLADQLLRSFHSPHAAAAHASLQAAAQSNLAEALSAPLAVAPAVWAEHEELRRVERTGLSALTAWADHRMSTPSALAQYLEAKS